MALHPAGWLLAKYAAGLPVQGKAHTCEQPTCMGPCLLALGSSRPWHTKRVFRLLVRVRVRVGVGVKARVKVRVRARARARLVLGLGLGLAHLCLSMAAQREGCRRAEHGEARVEELEVHA